MIYDAMLEGLLAFLGFSTVWKSFGKDLDL